MLGWEMKFDEKMKRKYFVDHIHKTTQWNGKTYNNSSKTCKQHTNMNTNKRLNKIAKRIADYRA